MKIRFIHASVLAALAWMNAVSALEANHNGFRMLVQEEEEEGPGRKHYPRGFRKKLGQHSSQLLSSQRKNQDEPVHATTGHYGRLLMKKHQQRFSRKLLVDEEGTSPPRQLISSACQSSLDTLYGGNPQFDQYNNDLLDAIVAGSGSCTDTVCIVNGIELKGTEAYLSLIQKCESLNAQPYDAYAFIDCTSPSVEYHDVFFFLSCIPDQCTSETDINDLGTMNEQSIADFLFENKGLNCTVDHTFRTSSSQVGQCQVDYFENFVFDDPDTTILELRSASDKIFDAVDSGCSTPPCSVDGRALLPNFDDLVDNCHNLGFDVWMEEFSILNCDMPSDNHVVENVFFCYPPSCSSVDEDVDQDVIEDYIDDTEELQEDYPSCDVTFDGERIPANPAFKACDDAYSKIQDDHPQFNDFWALILESSNRGCISPPCSVDGRDVDSAEFDRLVSECRALGADPWVDSLETDCTGSVYDFAITNWLDCVPKVCDVAAQTERYIELSQDYYIAEARNNANDPTCKVEFQAEKLETGGSAATSTTFSFGQGLVFVVALASYLWM